MDINELIAREEIRNLIHGYCRAIDEKDWDTVRGSFMEDAIIYHGPFMGSVDEFMGFVVDVLAKMLVINHSVGSIMIKIAGNKAEMHSAFTAFHTISGEVEELVTIKTYGKDVDWLVGGKYIDKLEKRAGVWRIIERKGSNDWSKLLVTRPA